MARSFDPALNHGFSATMSVAASPCWFAAWIKTSNTTTTTVPMALLELTGTETANYCVYRGATTDKMTAASFISGGAFGEAASSASLTSGAWEHVVCSYASSTDRTVWLNGASSNNTTSVTVSTSDRFGIGSYSVGINEWDGDMAMVGLWTGSPTDADVQALYDGFSPRRVQPQNLIDSWNLLERSVNANGVRGYVAGATGTPPSAAHPRAYGF